MTTINTHNAKIKIDIINYKNNRKLYCYRIVIEKWQKNETELDVIFLISQQHS